MAVSLTCAFLEALEHLGRRVPVPFLQGRENSITGFDMASVRVLVVYYVVDSRVLVGEVVEFAFLARPELNGESMSQNLVFNIKS
jgi:hypothetical protein